MNDEARLRQAVRITQDRFRNGIGQVGIQDVGFIGNTGGTYAWEPALIVDIDICLFVARKDCVLGRWLIEAGEAIRVELDAIGIDFELKVLRGPYKPALWRLVRPVAVAHLAVFTEASYAAGSPLLRWAWRKYVGVVDAGRFNSGSSGLPTWSDLREMASRRLARICEGRVQMTEWVLPGFEEHVHSFDADHPVFTEYCLAAPLVCARNHGRLLHRMEADQLSNREYVAWYGREVLASAALDELLRLKELARQNGFEGLLPTAKDLAVVYLGELVTHLERQAHLAPR